MLTRKQACLLIDYLDTMEDVTNHQHNMAEMAEKGISEKELDEACRALGVIAERTYSIL